MYNLCKTEKTAKRQRAIEQKLLELMMTKTYDSITVTELCEELDMPRKAFYRYFDGKESTLKGLIEHSLSEFTGSDRGDSPRLLHKELEQFFVFWYEKRDLLTVLEKNGLTGMILDASVSFPINNMVSLGRLLPDDEEDSRRPIFRFAIGGLISIMLDWYHDSFRASVPDMARLAVRILTKPPFPNLDTLGMADLPI